jgi:hypothetical protein
MIDAEWLPETDTEPAFEQLKRCFEGDPEGQQKLDLLAEVPASALLKAPTWLEQPKAVFALGRANTGKSRWGRLYSGFLPDAIVTHVSMRQLAATFDTEVTRAMPTIVGKRMLIGDELSHKI